MSETLIPEAAAGDAAFRHLLEAPDSPLAGLERLSGIMAARIGELQAALATERGRALELERQLGLAEARLAVEAMHSAGLAAQAAHLLGLGTAAPEAAEPSGETYVDGTPKSRLALIYEAAFDAQGRDMGIDAPERFRDG
ncbi:hypothetical protein ACFOD4_21255 [Pseudoroseomonas globiformis]|uniref:Uncharacterized protein n=1 Tax=Teichococcus globiformis TaxID=2307229 RepID=A0ABV7G8P2_9PROT